MRSHQLIFWRHWVIERNSLPVVNIPSLSTLITLSFISFRSQFLSYDGWLHTYGSRKAMGTILHRISEESCDVMSNCVCQNSSQLAVFEDRKIIRSILEITSIMDIGYMIYGLVYYRKMDKFESYSRHIYCPYTRWIQKNSNVCWNIWLSTKLMIGVSYGYCWYVHLNWLEFKETVVWF